MKIYDDKSRVASERNIWIKRGYAMADLHSIQFSFRYTNNSADDQRERFYEAAETVRYQENLDRSRIMAQVMAAIAEKFVCYQYTKEEPAPYGSDRWDLFFWCNCLVEDVSVATYEKWVEQIILFKWNRVYPQDRAFDIDLTQNRWKLQSTEDFPGHSHENVTMEVYVR